MIGDKIRRRTKELNAIRKAKEYITVFQEHRKRTYPYSEEDEEGIITHLSPRKVSMLFKGITPQEGYDRAINKFKLIGRIHKVKIALEGDKVVVDF